MLTVCAKTLLVVSSTTSSPPNKLFIFRFTIPSNSINLFKFVEQSDASENVIRFQSSLYICLSGLRTGIMSCSYPVRDEYI